MTQTLCVGVDRRLRRDLLANDLSAILDGDFTDLTALNTLYGIVWKTQLESEVEGTWFKTCFPVKSSGTSSAGEPESGRGTTIYVSPDFTTIYVSPDFASRSAIIRDKENVVDL